MPPAPRARPSDPGKAGAVLRVGAVPLALILAFVAAVAISVLVDVGDNPVCDEITSAQRAVGGYECYDFSGSVKPIVQGAGWLGGIVTAVAALLAAAFAIRGRGGRLLLAAMGAGAALLGISILAAQL